MTAAEILNFTRRGIKDYKTLPVRITEEIVTSSYTETGEVDYNIYYTQNMPITSGSSSDAYFLGGRWSYTVGDTGDDGTRWIQFVVASGSFVLDSGATQVADGETVKIGYVYDEPQNYAYRDSELNLWIKDAAGWVNKATCGITAYVITGSVYDTTFAISPEPSTYLGILISKRAQLDMRLAELAEGDTRGIYVKQGMIAIDTTKGGVTRRLNVKDLYDEIQNMVDNIIIGECDGEKIDVYSTLDQNVYDTGYYMETNAGYNEDINNG